MPLSRRVLPVRNLIPLFLLLAVVIAAWGCGSPEGPLSPDSGDSGQSLTQTDSGEGGISFQATIVTSEYMAERGHPPDHVGFLVRLDTHSGSLGDYDLTALTELRDSAGGVELPSSWESMSDDSHHRSGLLSFKRNSSGATQEARQIELALRDVGGVSERVLRWAMPLPEPS